MNKAATNKEVRIFNQKNIVNTLFQYGPMTKSELADKLGLSLPTVSVINKNLAAKGLIALGDKLESSGGRPAQYIKLVFDARFSLGVDISSRHVRLALINLGPKMSCSAKHRLDFTGTESYWRHVSQMIKDFMEANAVNTSRLLGIGISLQVPIQDGHPVVTTGEAHDNALWNFEQIRSWLGFDVAIQNDAKSASLSQVWGFGEDRDVIYLMLSNGVGGAIISNRHLLNEASKNAEFGHMIVRENGRPCSCGQRGCLGSYCSSRALQDQAGVDLDEFFSRLAAGDAVFQLIWQDYLAMLALAINNIRVIFDTDVVIGGEMSPYVERDLPALREQLSRRNPFGEPGNYVRICSHGEFDSAIGAALVHIDKFLS